MSGSICQNKMSSFESILEKESVLENMELEKTVIQDLDKTLVPKTPIDFIRDRDVNTNTNPNANPIPIPIINTSPSPITPNEIHYREFQSNTKDNIPASGGEYSSSESIDRNENQKEVSVSDFSSSDRGGIVYDIIHIFDDVYSYGRTLIENNYFNFSENDDFNLVYPNIYIGNYSTSTNLELLKNVGITHIISVIPTFNPPFSDKFKYLHIQAYDDQTQDLSQYFENCNAFIGDVLNESGKVLIHCMVGRSRSVTMFLAFLINVIRGNFNQNIVNLGSDNDVSNEVEYKQFGKSRNTNINQNTHSKIRDTQNEDINQIEYIKPELSNKYRNFINYKKETMIREVDELMEKYKLFQKEMNIFADDIVSDTSIEQLKQQFSNIFIVQILKYIKKYRSMASPNSYFVSQLIELLM